MLDDTIVLPMKFPMFANLSGDVSFCTPLFYICWGFIRFKMSLWHFDHRDMILFSKIPAVERSRTLQRNAESIDRRNTQVSQNYVTRSPTFYSQTVSSFLSRFSYLAQPSLGISHSQLNRRPKLYLHFENLESPIVAQLYPIQLYPTNGKIQRSSPTCGIIERKTKKRNRYRHEERRESGREREREREGTTIRR